MGRIEIIITTTLSLIAAFYYVFNKLESKKGNKPNKHFKPDTKKIKIHPGHIFLLAIAVFVVFGYFNENRHIDNINKNKCISYGRVTKYISLYKSSKGYNYEFYRDNKIYQGFYSHWPNTLPIINKVFPVALDCDDPENNAILILPNDFKRYNLYFPDSLNWLIQYD